MKIKSREELNKDYNEIDILLKDLLPKYIALNKNMIHDVSKRLSAKGILTGFTSGVFMGIKSTSELTEVEQLGSFLKAVYEQGMEYKNNPLYKNNLILPDLEKLNPSLYYEDVELKRIDEYQVERKEKTNIIRFDNARQTSEFSWKIDKLEWKTLVDLFNNGLINYNIRTQRQTTKKLYKGQVIEKITINPRSVKEIKQAYKEGTFFPNAITLNIRQNGHERFKVTDKYPREDKDRAEDEKIKIVEIEVTDESVVDIIDGMHRLMAAVELLEEDPNATNWTEVNLYYLDENRAVDFIRQENKRNEIEEQHIEKISYDNVGINIAKSLNSDRSCRLLGNVAEDMMKLKVQNKMVELLTLGNAINQNFIDIKTESAKMFKVKKYLAKFSNFFIDHYEGYFNAKSENINIYQRNNMFYGIVGLASELYEVEGWEYILLELLEKIEIDDLLSKVTTRRTPKPQDIKNIINAFRNLYKDNKERMNING